MSPQEAIPPTPTEPERTPRESKCEQALVLWLRWNDAYKRINAALSADPERREDFAEMIGELDELREMAVALSKEVLHD